MVLRSYHYTYYINFFIFVNELNRVSLWKQDFLGQTRLVCPDPFIKLVNLGWRLFPVKNCPGTANVNKPDERAGFL